MFMFALPLPSLRHPPRRLLPIFSLLLVLIGGYPLRATDYFLTEGGDFSAPIWESDSASNPFGPPGSDDNAYLQVAGATVTAEGIAVDTLLTDEVSLVISGTCSCQTYTPYPGSGLAGSGTLTAQTIDAGLEPALPFVTNLGGGANITVTNLKGSTTLSGGTLQVQNYAGSADGGSDIAVESGVASIQNGGVIEGLCLVDGEGSQLSLPSIMNSTADHYVVVSEGAQLKVFGQVVSELANIDGMLTVGSDLTVDSDGGVASGAGFSGATVSVGGDFILGDTDAGGSSLAMDQGTVFTCNGHAVLGENPPGNGTLTMYGEGTVWRTLGGLAIGDSGRGDLEVQNGSQLMLGGSVFALGLAPGGSGVLNADGAGTLIDARGSVTSVARGTKSSGRLSLTGGASLLLSQTFYVGDGGSGALNIELGSQASITGSNIKFAIGYQATGVGKISVDGAGSQFAVGRTVLAVIGFRGNGTLAESQGATVQADVVELGAFPKAQGSILLDGTGTTWLNTDNIFVGGSEKAQPAGTGTVTVQNAAQMRVATNPGGKLFLSATGSVVLDATGEIAVGTGAFGPPGTLRVTSGGRVTGKGKVQGQVIVARGGVFEPGGDPGTFTIKGGFDQTDGGGGEMDIEVGGTKAGVNYDQLVVSGPVKLGGTLKINLVNGYAPKAGDKLAFIKAASTTGSFTKISSPGLTVKANRSAGGIALDVMEVTAGLPVQTSATAASGTLGTAFTYKAAATNKPTTYTATGLPTGLSVNKSSGEISGTPTAAGDFQVVLGFAGASAIGAGVLDLDIAGTGPTVKPPPPTLAKVTVKATDPLAYEHDKLTGLFTVTRTGTTTKPLKVDYTVQGSATPGTDYQKLSGSITILADSVTARIKVKPIDAGITGGGKRTVKLMLKPESDYTLGAPAAAKVNIVEDD
jgi:T5SS/PEP-CTERM-associated repeat protein